jgi:hypothetical protein
MTDKPVEQTADLEAEVVRLSHAYAREYDCARRFAVRVNDLEERLFKAEHRLRQLGYERCYSIACGCRGYHFNGRD